MPVHIEPFVFTVRCFANGDGWGDDYKVALTIQKIGKIGYCSACRGEFNIGDYRELEQKMKEYGILKLKWGRKCPQS